VERGSSTENYSVAEGSGEGGRGVEAGWGKGASSKGMARGRSRRNTCINYEDVIYEHPS
jgi:hypothetical protein